MQEHGSTRSNKRSIGLDMMRKSLQLWCKSVVGSLLLRLQVVQSGEKRQLWCLVLVPAGAGNSGDVR